MNTQLKKVPKKQRTDWKMVSVNSNQEIYITANGRYICVQGNQQASGYISDFGKSSISISCGFCGYRLRVFIWSLAGSGKRCDCCNSLLGSNSTFASIDSDTPKDLLARAIQI